MRAAIIPSRHARSKRRAARRKWPLGWTAVAMFAAGLALWAFIIFAGSKLL